MTEIDTETFLTDLYALRKIVQFQTGVHRLKLTVWGRQGPPPHMLVSGMSLPSPPGASASSPSHVAVGRHQIGIAHMKLTLYIAGALHIAFGIFFLLASSGAPASEGGAYLGPGLGGTIGGFVMLALGRAIQLLKRIERNGRPLP